MFHRVFNLCVYLKERHWYGVLYILNCSLHPWPFQVAARVTHLYLWFLLHIKERPKFQLMVNLMVRPLLSYNMLHHSLKSWAYLIWTHFKFRIWAKLRLDPLASCTDSDLASAADTEMHRSGPFWIKNLLLSIRNAPRCWPLRVCFSFGSQASSSLVLQSWPFPLMLTLSWAPFAQGSSMGWQRLCEVGIIIWQLPWSILLSLFFFSQILLPSLRVCSVPSVVSDSLRPYRPYIARQAALSMEFSR